MAKVTLHDLKLAAEQYKGVPLLLHCRICGADCSATPGDYFNCADSYTFRCGGYGGAFAHPDADMILAVKETRYRRVKVAA